MNPIERHYRLQVMRERILDIAGELMPITDDMKNDAALQRIAQAGISLENAVTHLRAVCTLESPEEMLELSLLQTKRPAEVLYFVPPNKNAG